MDDLNDIQIGILENLLIQLKGQLIEAIKRGQESSKVVSLDDPIGRLSRVDALQQQKMAAEGLRRLELKLNQVELALKKIADREYGFCSQCEELIPFGRLKIKPESIMCLSCQGKTEEGS